jgi:hypothetical protein
MSALYPPLRGDDMPRALLLVVAALCAACGREKPGNASASAYTSDSDSIAREEGFAGTNTGVELEAPRLIPAIQNQLNLMTDGSQPINPDNLIAYKNMAGDLVNSMIADLYRAGFADSGNFKALSDSVLAELGGGATTPPDLEKHEVPGHVTRMRRLISLYQETMRKAGESQPS